MAIQNTDQRAASLNLTSWLFLPMTFRSRKIMKITKTLNNTNTNISVLFTG